MRVKTEEDHVLLYGLGVVDKKQVGNNLQPEAVLFFIAANDETPVVREATAADYPGGVMPKKEEVVHN